MVTLWYSVDILWKHLYGDSSKHQVISRLFGAITLIGFHWREKLQKGWVFTIHYAVEKESTGEFIGYIGLHQIGFAVVFTTRVEIGWRLAADYHNQGYATEAAKAVLNLAKDFGIERLFSFTAKINAPSERVHPKLSNGWSLCSHMQYKTKRRIAMKKSQLFANPIQGMLLLSTALLFCCL